MSSISNNAINTVLNNTWNTTSTLRQDKSDIPVDGDMYYDQNINRMQVYSNNAWYEITYKFDQWSPNNKKRKNKIGNIFNE